MRSRLLNILHRGCPRRRYSSAPAAQFSVPLLDPCTSIPVQNVSDFVLSDFPGRSSLPALVCGASGKQFTYGQVSSLSRQWGAALLHTGLRPGDKVAVIVPNCPEFGPVLFGSLGVGVTLVPVSPLFTPAEVARVLEMAQPRLLVTIDPLVPLVVAAQEGADSLLPMVTLSDSPSSSATPFSQFTANDGSLYDSRQAIDPLTSLAVLPFSSGTTGPPKGVMLTHQNLTSMMVQFSDLPSGCALPALKLGEEQKVGLSVIPMFHIYGLACNLMHALVLGTKQVILPRFEPASFLACMEEHRPHALNIVPPLVAFLALNPAVTKDTHLSRAAHICSGGSPVSNQIVAALRKKVGHCEIKEGYGLTETCAGVSRTHISMSESLRGTVGKLIGGTEARVEDPHTRQLVELGQPGELVVRGPQVMVGYYKNPAATAEVLSEDGWFRTGDVVTADQEGNFTIVDRIKDMIKVKGYQVSPTEVEGVILRMPGVQEVSVVGVPHPVFGEAPRAFIVRAAGREVTEGEVHAVMEEELAVYKGLAGGMVWMEELPKSPTGKVLRKELRQL